MKRPHAFVLWGLLVSWPAWGSAQAPDPWATPPEDSAPASPESASPPPVDQASSEPVAVEPDTQTTAPEAAQATAPEAAPASPPAPAPAQSTDSHRDRKRAARESPWRGPRVELAYRIYSLRDDQGGRTANTACFSGFLPTRWFRGGGGVEAGSRVYEYGDNEGLVSGNVFAGYQHLRDLGRVVPYLVVVGELGVLFGQRFHTLLSLTLRGAGMELGADVNLVKSLYVGLGVGFMLYTIDDLAYDSWGLRLAIGL